MWKSIFLMVIMWGVSGLGMIQSQEIPDILNFSRGEYGGGNKNWGFAEDSAGNLYVANTEGILIYNGMNWQKVHLPNHRIPRCLYTGKDGKVYAGGFETIGYVDRSDPGEPTFVEIGEDILKGTEEEIWHIAGNEDQMMFQSFAIMVFYDGEQLELYRPGENIMFGQWIHDQLYVPQIEQGIYLIKDQKVTTISTSGIPEDAVISGIVRYKEEALMISTRNHGLFIIDHVGVQAVKGSLNHQLKSDQINKLVRLNSGVYAIGTIQNGVYITEDLQHVKYHINKTNGLNNNTVLSLYETHAGALCVGLDIGLDIWKIHHPDLYYYDVDGHLGTVFTTAYYLDKFYIGTNQGVFIQNEWGKFDMIPGSQGQVWCLEIVGDDLLCGHNTGTLQWVDGRFVSVSGITGGIHMQVLKDGRILQSTYNGLVLLEKNDGRWQVAVRIAGTDKLVDRFVYLDGNLIGLHPYFGLVYYRFSPEMDEVIYRKTFPDLEVQIGRNKLGLLLYKDHLLIWMDNDFYEISSHDELQPISCSLRSEIENWAGGQLEYYIKKPVSHNVKQNKFITYYPDRDLVIKSMEEGYVRHFLQDDTWMSSLPLWSLDYVWVNGQYIPDRGATLELNPGLQSLRIQLRKGSDFLSDDIHPEYCLMNYDPDWNVVPGDGKLEFLHLSHGSYRLGLRAPGTEPYDLLHFIVHPHWYESWPGWILFLILFAAILGYFNHRNKKKIKAEKEKMKKEKEAALEAERIKARAAHLEHEVTYKSKMLANSAMTMVQKNEMLNELKEVIKKESARSNSVKSVRSKAIKLIDRNLNSDESLEVFDRNFAEVHEDFLERLKKTYPNIKPGDLRLAAYIRMHMTSKEIAPLLQISVRSVENKRYRLRKKMNLSPDTNLSEHLMRF